MFLDGLNYAAIARNLAEGVGTFWTPHYTDTLYPQFREQPPLGFALQAGAFYVLGDHLFVERVYSLLTGAITGFLIALIWRRTVGTAHLDWLPVAFWLVPSTVTWAMVNNMLENTQAALTTAAVFAFVRAWQAERRAHFWAAASAICILAAVLTKGPVGFFPLAAPFLAASVARDGAAKGLKTAVIMAATLAAAIGVCFATIESRQALRLYWDTQLLATISGARGGGRWTSLLRHLSGGIILRMGGLLALIWTASRFSPRRHDQGQRTMWPVFFLLLAVAASLPVALSSRITGHYLVPSIPLYALGFASLAALLAGPALDRWAGRTLVLRFTTALGAVLLIAALAAPAAGVSFERPRDAAWIAEYYALAPFLEPRTVVATCAAAEKDWGAHAYLQRFFKISLEARGTVGRRQFLQFTDRPCDQPEGCSVAVSSQRLRLLTCTRLSP